MQKEKTDAINYIFVKIDNCRLFLIVEKKERTIDEPTCNCCMGCNLKGIFKEPTNNYKSMI
jgi:hypothetical protein